MDGLNQNSMSMAKPPVISATQYQWEHNLDTLLQQIEKHMKLNAKTLIVQVMSDHVEHLVLVTYIFTKKNDDGKN
jgi:hypothetical protein